jgi:hypothetical protein
MPKVLNARQAGTKPAADRAYVGRPSKWESVGDWSRRCCPELRDWPPPCRLLPQQQVWCCVAASEAIGHNRSETREINVI